MVWTVVFASLQPAFAQEREEVCARVETVLGVQNQLLEFYAVEDESAPIPRGLITKLHGTLKTGTPLRESSSFKVLSDGNKAAVDVTGPDGKLQLWEIDIAFDHERKPHGIQLVYSTSAWAELESLPGADVLKPLSWFQDLDEDGVDEFVAWNSVMPTGKAAIGSSNVFVVGVYRFTPEGFARDGSLSMRLQVQLAGLYERLVAADPNAPGVATYEGTALALRGTCPAATVESEG